MLDVEGSLEKEQKQALERIIEEFNDVFALSQDGLKCTKVMRHVIDTDGYVPIKQLP